MLLLLLGAAGHGLWGAKPRVVESQTPYHLFVGHQVSVKIDGEVRAVSAFQDNHALVEEAGDTRAYPLSQLDHLALQNTVRFASRQVRFDKVRSVAAFSPARDPALQNIANQMNLRNEASHAANLAHAEMVGANTSINLNDRGEVIPNTERQLDAMQNLDATQREWEEINEFMTPGMAHELDENVHQTGNDAVKVDFALSSPIPLSDPYILFVFGVTVPDAPYVRKWVAQVRPLPNLTDRPKNLSYLIVGLPPGFTLEETKLAVIHGGSELASNLSERHFSLSRREAWDYLVTTHVADNRSQTALAQPLRELNAVLRPRVESELSSLRRYTIQIDETGRVAAIEVEDRQRGEEIPEAVSRTLGDFAFLPALSDGTPIPSTYRGTLADLF